MSTQTGLTGPNGISLLKSDQRVDGAIDFVGTTQSRQMCEDS